MKLFKKVAAAVLAGVMALSMVACAPVTPDVPVVPDVPVTNSPVDEILYWLNYQINKHNANLKDDYSGEMAKAYGHVVNDTALANKAAVVLDAIASEDADWDTTGAVSVKKSAIDAALNKKGQSLDIDNVYVVDAEYGILSANVIEDAVTMSYAFDLAELKYSKLKPAGKQILALSGLSAAANSTDNDGEYVDVKIGIASRTIYGTTYVVIVAA